MALAVRRVWVRNRPGNVQRFGDGNAELCVYLQSFRGKSSQDLLRGLAVAVWHWLYIEFG